MSSKVTPGARRPDGRLACEVPVRVLHCIDGRALCRLRFDCDAERCQNFALRSAL